MSFGNLITDGTQEAIGTVGYVVGFNLALERVKEIQGVQLQNVSGVSLSDTNIAAYSSLASLMDLCDDVNAPDFGWFASGVNVYVFCKTATWPYTSNTRIGFYFQGNPSELMGATTDELPEEFPEAAKGLLKGLILQGAFELLGERVPRELTNGIAKEKKKLGV